MKKAWELTSTNMANKITPGNQRWIGDVCRPHKQQYFHQTESQDSLGRKVDHFHFHTNQNQKDDEKRRENDVEGEGEVNLDKRDLQGD